MAYGYDRWFIPIVIESGTGDQIQLTIGGAATLVTLTAGTYWTYNAVSSSEEITGYPSLYLEITDKLDAVAGSTNTYSFQAAAPVGTSLEDYRALRLVRDTGSDTFSLDFSSPAFTLDKRLFGVAADYATDELSSSGVIGPLGQLYGQWVSPRRPSMKISNAKVKINLSTEDTARDDLYVMEWTARRRRVFVYRHIPAAWVHKKRAGDLDYAEVAGLVQGDTRQAFEHVWDALRTYADVIVLHDEGDQSTAWSAEANHSADVEIVRLYSAEAGADFEKIATMEAMGGEFYRLEIPVVRRGGSYEQ